MENPLYKKQHLFPIEEIDAYRSTLLKDFLLLVKQEVGLRVLETWFKSIEIEYCDAIDKKIIIQTPNPFVEQWLNKHYKEICQNIFCRLLNEKNMHIFFVSKKKSSADVEIPEIIKSSSIIKSEEKKNKNLTFGVAKIEKKESILNSQYTFDNFIIGPNNELATSASKAIAENKSTIFNPLFIYGGSGLGKTHLLHAIGNYIKYNAPETNILYQPADKFIQDFIRSIRSNTVDGFEKSFDKIDILLLDDIQVISKKEQTQEIFFKIFNMLYSMKKQIIITSDTMPRDISGLANRIKSRFEGGLIVDVHMPPFETIIAILYKKAEMYKIKLPLDIAHYLASSSISSIRELEGILLRIIAYTTFTKSPFNLNTVSQIIINKEKKKIDVNFSAIVSLVAGTYKINLTTLRSQDRSKKTSYARHISMYLMKRWTDKSYKDIGMFLYRQDHTSVMYACSKIEAERKKNQELSDTLTKIEKDLVQLTQTQERE